MQRAIDETERRREKQRAYNRERGITARGVQKAVTDIMEGAYVDGTAPYRKLDRLSEESVAYAAMPIDTLLRKVKQLEEKMYRHARDLEFEEAAGIRDEIKRIQSYGLGLPDVKAG